VLDTLDRKIRQMHAALDALGTTDLSGVKPEIEITAAYTSMKVDFNASSNPIELANIATLLVANIASIKDHLKAWCKAKGLTFQGDTLINSNVAVALVHDLWNVDKHAELSSKPRSGHTPKLRNMMQALVLTTGTQASADVFVSIDPHSGKITSGSSHGGSAKISLDAEIVDEHGNFLRDFSSTCIEAVEAWERALIAAGVPLP
jgi:hypothetical protein